MRGRSIRLSILILIILGISVVALAFRDVNVDLPGFPALQRGGNGPLGLKLGLDLRGGSHLVYQADTSTQMSFTFTEDANKQDIIGVLEESGIASFEVTTEGARQAKIKTSFLDEAARTALLDAMEEQVAPIDEELFEFSETPDPTPDQMEGVLAIIKNRVNLSGTEEPIVQLFGENRIVVQLPGTGGSVTNVEFSEATSTGDLKDLLKRRGYERFTVNDDAESEAEADRVYRIRTRALNKKGRADFEEILSGGIGAINSIQITGAIEEAKSLIGQTARLEFKERTCENSISCVDPEDAGLSLTGDNLENAYPERNQTGEWTVNIQFDGEGSDIFSELTQRISQQQDTKRIAIFLDDELLLAPVSLAWIPNGRSVLTGRFTREGARTLAIQLESGSLPVPLKLIQERDVDALLGSRSLNASLLAGFLGLGLVMVFMVAYYRMAGVVASVALVFYTIVVIAVFKMYPVTLTLAHIGGFLLSIGLAVDANILIFERMKEEIRVGRTLASSMEVGFNRAWPAIRDGNLSTLITCVVLLWFGSRLGGGLVIGFAFSLLVGVLVSMFTAVVVSRNLLQLLAWIGLGRQIGMFTPEGARQPSPAGTRPRAPQGGR